MRRLTRLLSKTPSVTSEKQLSSSISRNGFHLLDLPEELLLQIESWLPYENALAFSLTCKYVYSLFFKRRKPNAKHRGREAQFLQLLERDSPHLLACPIHEFLYTWNKQRTRQYSCPRCVARHREPPGSYVVCNKGCRRAFYGIFEPERRLILRHALLGPEYGVSARNLNHVCKASFSKKANEITPKVVNGRLMVWRTHYYSFRVTDDPISESPIQAFDEAICVHSELGLRAVIFAAFLHAKAQDASATEPAFWQCQTRFKCSHCSTDMRLRYTRPSPMLMEVMVDAIQDLGGLDELAVAQRQVLGLKYNWRVRRLEDQDKVQRLCEDLEEAYFGNRPEEATARVDAIPDDVAFITQWSFHARSRNPLIYLHDKISPLKETGTPSHLVFEPYDTV